MRDVPDILLADARNYLDITWADADGDVKLLGILARGMGYLDHAAGVELDYGEGTAARAVSFYRWRDGKIVQMTEYWGDIGPAPEWRIKKNLDYGNHLPL